VNEKAQERARIGDENQQIAEIDGALSHAGSSTRATAREPRAHRAVSDVNRAQRAHFEL
jgi:hypothetical protein